MRSILQLAISFFSLLTLASAQGDRFCDSDICFTRFSQSGVSVGFVFPPDPDSTTPSEFLGIITAPSNLGWIGLSLGGPMTDSLLLVAWLDGNTGRISSRFTSDYAPPAAYSGPKLTVFGSMTGKNGSSQRIVFRCQDCTSWQGGGKIGQPTWEVGWAGSTSAPSNPGDAGSAIQKHSETGFGELKVERSSSYQSYITKLQGGGSTAAPNGGSTSRTSGTGTATGSRTTSGTASATGTSTANTTATGTETSGNPEETDSSGAVSLMSNAFITSLTGLLAGAGLYALL